MLSPSIITKSKGNCWRSVVIRSATWYCGASPVPMSPIAANLTEPAWSGNLNSSPRAQKAMKLRIRMAMRAFRIKFEALVRFRENVGNPVDDQICFDVQKNQLATHNAVRHLIRQFGKPKQQSGGQCGVGHAV